MSRSEAEATTVFAMLSLDTLTNFLTLGFILTIPVLFAKLIRLHLFGTYRFFALYIAFEFIRSSILKLIPFRTDLYGHAYFSMQAAACVLYLMVILEVYGLVLKDHAGLMTLGRRVMIGGFAIATAVTGVTLTLDLTQPQPTFPVLQTLLLAERSVMFILLLLMLLITLFVSYFPVTLRRNIVIHTAVFSAFFFSRTAALLVRTVTGETGLEAVNLALRLVSLGCLGIWIVCLRRPEADVIVKSGRKLSAEEEYRVLSHLGALNRTLIGSSRE